jgi:hypothetical protein
MDKLHPRLQPMRIKEKLFTYELRVELHPVNQIAERNASIGWQPMRMKDRSIQQIRWQYKYKCNWSIIRGNATWRRATCNGTAVGTYFPCEAG